MKVTIGRIVQYKTTKEDRIRLSESNKVNNARNELPGIVVAVDEERVNLQVFLDGQDRTMWITNIKQGDKEGEWNWFPRI